MIFKIIKCNFFSDAFVIVIMVLSVLEATSANQQPIVKIMYDVTSVVENSNEYDQNITQKLLVDYDVTIGNRTNLYYEVNAKLSYNCTGLYNPSLCGYFPVTGISVIFKKNTTIKNAKNLSKSVTVLTNETLFKMLKSQSSILSSVGFSLALNRSHCLYSSAMESLIAQLENDVGNLLRKDKLNVKFAIEYDTRFLECYKHHHLSFFGNVDMTILRVELTPLTTRLSYGIFSEMMTSLVRENHQFIRKLNPKCKLYVRLVPDNYKQAISGKSYHRYETLMLTYLKSWSQQPSTDIHTHYIVVPPHKNSIIAESTSYIKEKVAAALQTVSIMNFTHSATRGTCRAWDTVGKVESIFNHTIVIATTYNEVKAFISPKCINFPKHSVSNHTASIVLKRTGSSDIIKIMENILLNKQIHRYLGVVYFDWDNLENAGGKNAAKDYETILNLIKRLRTVKVGCYVNPLNATLFQNKWNFSIHEKIFRKCLQNLPMSQHVLLQYALGLYEKHTIVDFLSVLRQVKEEYEMAFPDIKFVPIIDFMSFLSGADLVDFKSGESSNFLFCNLGLITLNEIFHATLAFANMHNWESIAFSPVSVFNNFWNWRYVPIPAGLDGTNFSLFIRSISGKSLEAKPLPMTYPCIEQTQIAAEHSTLRSNQYSGISVDVDLTRAKLLRVELRTALLFALGKFTSAELIVKKKEGLQLAKLALTRSFMNAIQQHSLVKKPVLFIQVPDEICTCRCDIIQHPGVIVLVSGWDDRTNDDNWHCKQKYISTTSNFGVAVNKCGVGINNKILKLKSLHFFRHVKYVMCTQTLSLSTKFSETEQNRFSQLLLDIYYIKSYLNEVFSRENSTVEVMFKIDFNPKSHNCSGWWQMERRLALFNQLNQFSSVYKIRCFFGNAFEHETSASSGGQCTPTWWRIRDYSNLANESVYVDLEEKHFQRPTELNFSFPIEEDAVNVPLPATFYATMGLLGILVLSLSIFLTMWIRLRCTKKQFLTQTEVNQFYLGSAVDYEETSATTSLNFINGTCMPFAGKYEIAIGNLEMGDIIGSGQFGVVHKGMLLTTSYSIEVAIKIPRSECSKEQFKSALSELKIICYIGNHTNIVSFLGAYTKEIETGMLYIVTEYYQNGSLESYLKKMQDFLQFNPVDVRKLKEFAFQIASGMKYVAEKRVIHGDLATRNVMLSTDLTCKIGDFGLSRRLYELSEYKKSSSEPMPWRWMAPESLNKMEFTTKSDVWSYAVTLWEIFTLGKLPYPGRIWTAQFVSELENGMHMGCPLYAPFNVYEKMLECWNLDPVKRPTFAQLWLYFLHIKSQCYQSC